MKQLLLTAIKYKKHYALLLVTLVGMVCFTLASYMEIATLGILTNKGPDFFEIFAPVQDGRLVKQEVITREMFDLRWDEIDLLGRGEISQLDTKEFLSKKKGGHFIDSLLRLLEEKVGLSGTNLEHLAYIIVFVAFFKAFSLFAHRYTTRLIAIKVSRDLRQNYFEHLQSMPMSFYQKYNIGSLSARVVGDAVVVAEGINSILTNYLQTPLTIASSLALCFYTSWKLSMIVFCGFPLIVFPIIFIARKVKKVAKQIQKNQENFTSVLIDYLSGIETIKMFSMESFSLDKYKSQNEAMAKLEQKSARYALSSRPIIHTIGMFFLATALLYGLYGAKMSVADVLVYCGSLHLLYEPIKKFADENANIQRGAAASERMHEVMSLKPQIEDAPDAAEFQGLDHEIEFRDVWFRYEKQWVLKGVSFKVKKGEMVAFVGPTGAGKSTLAQLLPRLFEPEKGKILVDGKSIKSFSQKSLRKQISFVPQKPFLFLDSIAENISYGENYSHEQVVDAAKCAYAHEFIEQLPNKYKTELTDGGGNLSGGQQQRLAIARALIKGGDILVMDEATSSLDAISENKIKRVIQQHRGKTTQILIAHRFSTIEDADKIIYLSNGEKIAEGSKEQLLKECPQFAKMWSTLYSEKLEFVRS